MTNNLLDELFLNLEKWDGSLAHGEQIINENHPLFEQLKQHDIIFDAKDSQKLKTIMTKTMMIRTQISAEKKKVVKQMSQMNQKDKMVNSYYTSSQDASFIDRAF